jgi:hypothetical protein
MHIAFMLKFQVENNAWQCSKYNERGSTKFIIYPANHTAMPTYKNI